MKKPTCILLCAGKGTRMQDNRTHKVCYEIAGIPAIIRLIDHLKLAGISRFIVVLGSQAEKVMACLADVPGVTFAYQPEATGTGSAALYGLRAMASMGISGPALIAMGDKIITPDVIEDLLHTYEEKPVGCVFATQPEEYNREGGRIVIQNGKVYGIVEKLDTCLCRVGEANPKDEKELLEIIESLPLTQKKKEKLFTVALKQFGQISPTYHLGGCDFTADEIEESGVINTATYLLDSKLAIQELAHVDGNNTQGEIYLTDAVNSIAKTAGASAVFVKEREKILTYSTMEDLFKLEEYFSPKVEAKREFHLASTWLKRLIEWKEDTKRYFFEIYGSDDSLLEERRGAYQEVLKAYIKEYGDQEVVIARAPGRVNLMGRHIEHRGGSINVISVNREMLAVVGRRDDDTVEIRNVCDKFPNRKFSITDCLRQYDTENWVDFIESDAISQMVMDSRGDWANYVKAGVLRLQLKDKRHIIFGMNMMFFGNIPMAAGLSSSSAIVVATMEAAVALNHTNLQAKEFIHICGEGEWFVGSRGGAGDHAAMKSGKHGMITHISFCPFEIQESIPFPDEYRMVVINSFVDAKKSAGARDQFNQRVASYEFGFMLLYEAYPQYRERMNFLKNINPQTLQVPPSVIYEMLLSLPERMTIVELFEVLPKSYHEKIKKIQKTHKAPSAYDIRSVILYGIAECERSEKCIELLKKHDYAMLGRLMNISHDGDRVEREGKAFDYSTSDIYLYRLINELKSEDPKQVFDAQLWMQPGGYSCSTPIIDQLVDKIKRQPGVIGTQLSGAGLGGCIMTFVEQEKAADLLAYLEKEYYDANHLPMGAKIFTSVEGSMTLPQFNGDR